MVLAAGILLIAALVVFLAAGKWRNPLSKKDLPKRLGINIQQDFSGVTYTQARGGHTLFKIHASKVVQLKQGNALLHEVVIELYGEDGARVDRISGNEFEYDEHAGLAKAAGPVEITVMRPGESLAVAPKGGELGKAAQTAGRGSIGSSRSSGASGSIHVKTSGLVFDRNSGVARTDQRVEFTLAQGSGSAVGAVFDSQGGTLELGHAVELTTERGGDAVRLTAGHAEFDRGAQVCRLTGAAASYRGGEAKAEDATVLFGADGAAQRLTAMNGFELTTVRGGRLASPQGYLEFGAHNEPRRGHMAGGVTMDEAGQGRTVHGTAPTLELAFDGRGVLRQAHLERGVRLVSDEAQQTAKGLLRTHREWDSPVADLLFRSAGHGQLELASIHGTGGVVVTGQSRRGDSAMAPSRLSAAEVTGTFGADSALKTMTGSGNAEMEETSLDGTRQTTHGDRLVANFSGERGGERGGRVRSGHAGSAQIASATVEGHVVLVQQARTKPGHAAAAPLRATAERAVYDSGGEWLHLFGSPHVENGGLQLAADRLDVSQASGKAFARGNVRATWLGADAGKAAGAVRTSEAAELGGQGPAHAIAAEAELNQTTGEATFTGQARLWQGVNSIAAPKIVLDRKGQMLRAEGAGAKESVRVVLVGAAAAGKGKAGGQAQPAVIRIRGGRLVYRAAERKVRMTGTAGGDVVAETADGTTQADEMELDLLPAAHATGASAAAHVDRLTARGHVTLRSEGREGTGEQLVFHGETGEYVLTGTAAAPPRLMDPTRGTVTGEALIFNSHDDSVRIEGGGSKTTTDTTVPRRRPRQG